jgi:predicted GNAT family N-acyltransferase
MTPIYRLTADEAELQAAFDLRRQVFVEEQGISGQLEFDGLDGEAIHTVAVDGGKVIGTARVRFPADNQAKIERMAVAKSARRKGIGGGMVSFLIAECRARQMRQVALHAQHNVVPFYRSYGFEEVGEPFREAGIKHIKMQMWL